VIIGARGTELALQQARVVRAELQARGVKADVVAIKTSADRKKKAPMDPREEHATALKELEKALLKKKVDCCVHSLKDLPHTLGDGLEIVALLPRDDPRDALIVNPVTGADSLDSLPTGSRVGASSLRRRAQLLAMRPDLEVVELRGTLTERLRKVETGQVHATIVAAAALARLGATQRITSYLEAPDWLPAPGQGVIAIEIRSGDESARAILAPLGDNATREETDAERAFLAAIDGGRLAPVGALMDSTEVLHGFVSDANGRHIVRGSVDRDGRTPEDTGRALARELRSRGAESILTELRNAQ
jgi:hydroxymethylbilane synthase